MFLEADTIQDNNSIECDLCIIGAGAAGMTIAHSLRDSNIRIVVLDSGDEGFDPRAQRLDVGANIGLDYLPLDSVRIRMLGGSTNHWEGSCNDFDEIDFTDRPWVKHGGWPLKKQSLVDYYKKAQSYVQLGPYDYDLHSWSNRLGLAVPAWFNHGLDGYVTQHSPPTRFGEVYGPVLKASGGIRVILGATALSLNVNSANTLAESLSVARFDKAPFSVRARRFILAMGGIENARFLLLNKLGNNLVGRYFMEHPYFRFMMMAPTPSFQRFVQSWDNVVYDGVRVSPSIQFSEEILRRKQFQNSRLAFEPTDRITASAGVEAFHEILSGGVRSPDEMLYHIGNLLLDVDMLADAASRKRFGTDVFPEAMEFVGYSIGCMSEQLPNPDSRVILSNTKDIFGQRQAIVDLQLSEGDQLSAGRLVKAASEEFGRAGIGRVRLLVPDRFEHWPPRRIGYGRHHMGTTRMSEHPATGVVDSNLRLHGTGNIYVAGSSVFPTGSHVPPTLTIVALALRLADHLRTNPP